MTLLANNAAAYVLVGNTLAGLVCKVDCYGQSIVRQCGIRRGALAVTRCLCVGPLDCNQCINPRILPLCVVHILIVQGQTGVNPDFGVGGPRMDVQDSNSIHLFVAPSN